MVLLCTDIFLVWQMSAWELCKSYGTYILVGMLYDNPYVMLYFQSLFFLDSVYTEGKAHFPCASSQFFFNSCLVCYPISSLLHAFQMLLQRKKYLLSFFGN